MREVLRLVDASQKINSNTAALRGYNLEIYAGDIVVVSGMAGSGLKGLFSFLNGTSGLTGGSVFIDEQSAPPLRDQSPLWDRIFIFGDARRQFENLSVAENLALLSARHPALQYFRRDAVNARAVRYLRAEGLDIDPSARIASLSYLERQKLNLLLAKMAHASLIVIDCTEELHGDEIAGELFNMVRQFQKEGIAFLLISYRDEPYEGLANRFQKIAYGRDIMERSGEEAWRRALNPRAEKAQTEKCPLIDGLWDEAISYMDMREYLQAVCTRSPDFWKREIGMPVPPATHCESEGVVLIPKDSAQLLPENLSIEDNVILTISERIRKGIVGYIPPRLMRSAAREFYRISGISPEKKWVSELSLLERKILSLYRWEQKKPCLMILEIPNFGMDRLDSIRLEAYLMHLVEKGIRLLILSDSLEQLKRLCGRITVTRQGGTACRLEDI